MANDTRLTWVQTSGLPEQHDRNRLKCVLFFVFVDTKHENLRITLQCAYVVSHHTDRRAGRTQTVFRTIATLFYKQAFYT